MTTMEMLIASPAHHFSQEHIVFGCIFNLEFEWIERENFWLLHVSDGEGHPLALGLKLQPDWPLYVHHVTPPIVFELVAQAPNQELNRHTLSQYYSLVAYEVV